MTPRTVEDDSSNSRRSLPEQQKITPRTAEDHSLNSSPLLKSGQGHAAFGRNFYVTKCIAHHSIPGPQQPPAARRYRPSPRQTDMVRLSRRRRFRLQQTTPALSRSMEEGDRI